MEILLTILATYAAIFIVGGTICYIKREAIYDALGFG
jgi:hypothetical protein